jgi:hypothetical protein
MKKLSAVQHITCATILSGAMLWAGAARAENTPYQSITELKAWNSKVDVYHTVPHGCGGPDARRYHLAVDKNNHVRFLLAALLSGRTVSLAYTCNGDYPDIGGVRFR